MKAAQILLISVLALFAVSSPVFASDFGWAEDFNIQAQADPSGFRARLATRFNLGDVQVKAVLSNFDSPSDAYIVLRLGEMSNRPTSYVVDRYRHNKAKGWGSLAKSLGIKPGSEEFHALKRGHDLQGGINNNKVLVSVYDRKNVNHGDKDTRNANHVDSDHGDERKKRKNKK